MLHEFTSQCHPCYQSDGAIYDWMKVLFSDGISYPCRLSAVIMETDFSYKLVVQSAKERTRTKSALLTEWTWNDQYYVISPESIVAPCFVISISDNTSKILETLPYDEWPAQFTSG